jgi:hypothetical protein
MRKLVWWSLAVLSLSIVALVAVVSISHAWNQRADDICREKAPRGTSGYSITWDWAERAYVCDYRGPLARKRRVGITDAFHHPGHRPRH